VKYPSFHSEKDIFRSPQSNRCWEPEQEFLWSQKIGTMLGRRTMQKSYLWPLLPVLNVMPSSLVP